MFRSTKKLMLLGFVVCLAKSQIALSMAKKVKNNDDKLRKDISVEELIIGAMENSATAKLIKLEASRGETATLASRASLDVNLFSTLSSLDSEAETISANSPSGTKSQNITIGASKQFTTGTSLTASISGADNSLTYPAPIGEREAGSGVVSLGIKQDLLANTFGKATRANLKSADLRRSSINYGIKNRLEEFAVEITGVFFNTHKAQLFFKASKLIEENQKKLLDISKVLFKRGNLEESDFLQIEAAYYNANENHANSRSNLKQLWNTSITLLGLPAAYKNVDPMEIEMKFQDREKYGSKICQVPTSRDLKKSNQFLQLSESFESSVQDMKGKKNSALPKLSLELNFNSENYEDKPTDALGDSLSFDNPSYNYVLNFAYPIGNSGNKAQVFESFRNLKAAQINMENFEEDQKTKIENSCINLERNIAKLARLKKIYKIQKTDQSLIRKDSN